MKFEVVYCEETIRVQVEAKDELDALAKARKLPDVKEFMATRDSSDMLVAEVLEVNE